MKKDQNTQVENVETVENAQTAQVANVENEQTIEEQTAARVLRAKLPALTARNFNFEKRTGNVFTASIVPVFNENGERVIENGAPKEKLSRKVVEIEDEDGVLLPEYADIAEDLNAKRAAAFVLSADTLKEKLTDKIAALQAEIEVCNEELDTMDATLAESCAVVMAVTLPEPTARVNVSAKLNDATEKLNKMRAMLLAAGMSEEEINEQLNG